jgi:hypothetical protein
MSLHVSSVTALIIRRSNCINTSSGMISLCDCLVCRYDRHIKQSLTQKQEINKYMKKCVKLVISKNSVLWPASETKNPLHFHYNNTCGKLKNNFIILSKYLKWLAHSCEHLGTGLCLRWRWCKPTYRRFRYLVPHLRQWKTCNVTLHVPRVQHVIIAGGCALMLMKTGYQSSKPVTTS